MAKAERFEDLKVWQVARETARVVYDISGKGESRRDYALCDQMRRAAVSMMANTLGVHAVLVHGQELGAELQSHLYVALDQGYITREEFQRVYDQLDGWARQVAALITYLLGRETQRTPRTQPTQRTQRTQRTRNPMNPTNEVL
ncbi:MAG: four helix bundle protein [Candidatus Acetothermia bacterium]|nr:four helix bundle protein [Candidatus Acetothermia bacterium]